MGYTLRGYTCSGTGAVLGYPRKVQLASYPGANGRLLKLAGRHVQASVGQRAHIHEHTMHPRACAAVLGCQAPGLWLSAGKPGGQGRRTFTI